MKAYLKNYRQSPRKVRLIADLIRGKKINEVLTMLSQGNKRADSPIKKLLKSAIANAKSSGIDENKLIVKEIMVDEGIVFKRYKPRARGRASMIRKKTSHISIVLGEQQKVKSTKRKVKNNKSINPNKLKS